MSELASYHSRKKTDATDALRSHRLGFWPYKEESRPMLGRDFSCTHLSLLLLINVIVSELS